MYKRIFDIENKLDEGMFLFGARQTGKSTLLKERFKGAIYYDLLNPGIRKAFKLNPISLWEALQDKPSGTLVIIDEIQKVPELLDVVHSLMVDRGLFFILSGSSSRKLKRSGANTLGGRAIPETLFPLVWPEVTDFQIDRAVQNGMLPRHYMVEDATKRLSGYVKVYLDEEIREEGEVRELDAFERFMRYLIMRTFPLIAVCRLRRSNRTFKFFMIRSLAMKFRHSERKLSEKSYRLHDSIISMSDWLTT